MRCKAVRFDRYGGTEVLELVETDIPDPGEGQVRVAVRAAGMNPGESKIRRGELEAIFPTTFPSGQGSDLAGTIERVGPGVTSFAAGDDVVGWTDLRASHAEAVVVPVSQLVSKPEEVSWAVAGALPVVGSTAWAALHAVKPAPGEVIVVAGAAGGVGSIASQLALRSRARVIGIAAQGDHPWLSSLGIEPIAPGDDLVDRVRSLSDQFDGFIDTVGGGYVRQAIELGVAASRIDTTIDFQAAAETGAKADGNAVGARPEVLAELLDLVAAGALELAVARTFSLAEVRAAYDYMEGPHERGKVVLVND